MLTVSRLSKSFGGRVLFEDASLQVNRGDRIALIGPTDFSRLTKTMSGGWIMRAHLARLLVAEPELLLLDEQVSEQTARTILGAFLFRGDDVFKPVGILSGGEQSRLVLAKMLLNPPNFLLLDEPTTHLDMASIQALIQALKQYDGTLLFISHDVHENSARAVQVNKELKSVTEELQSLSPEWERLVDVAKTSNSLQRSQISKDL
jgi:ATP-binding cassette, subfamily F, member 3